MSKTKFASYFIIGGLEASAGLEADESGLASDLTDNPLERSYKPAILRHLPEATSWSNYNPEALSRLILPNGLRFCTDKEIRTLVPKSHSFVLTKEDGEKCFGVSLIFYEEVKDINICHAVHTLQKMYTTEVEVVGGASSIRRTRNEQRPRSAQKPGSDRNERSRSLPRHYQQSRLSSSTLDLSEASYDYRKSVLYVTKAIALVLNEPLVFAAEKVLGCMQKYICKHDYDVNVLESLVYNLLFDIPLPSAGRSVRFWCLGEVMTLSMPKVPVELHQFDYNLLEFFDMLGVENAVKLLVIVLLEHQVLVYSSEFDKLMLVCEAITNLMYPFKWPHVYVPILPPSLENFLDAPVPYIMGLLRPTTDLELYKHGSIGILDIDHGELELPEELPEFPYEAEFIKEIENAILQYGGREGVTLLKEHAIEQREVLESSMNQNTPRSRLTGSRDGLDESSDTMEQLNQMISKFESLSSNSSKSKKIDTTLERLRCNNAIREVFANRFCHMFLSYEHFVILQEQDVEDDLTPEMADDKSQTANFDKISFLSDQNHAHLPFLSSFLETQTFSTFIDEAIVRLSEDVFKETPFDRRLNSIKEKFGESLVRTPTYTQCESITLTDDVMAARLKKVELTVTPQRTMTTGKKAAAVLESGIFPLLDPSKFHNKNDDNMMSKAVFVKGDRSSKSIDAVLMSTASSASNKISLLNASPASIAETNWNFVNQLLREAKSKTKRILLEKLGSEAVEWGHGDTSMMFTGSEENMLVASVCDLCERIWSHGLQSHQRKSALWHYLYKFGRTNEKLLRFKGTLGVQAYCVPLISSKPYILPDHSRPIQVVIDPKTKKANFDSEIMAVMHNVATMHEIKTEIGYARAWIRLALERKKLSNYLHVLVNDANMLKTLYKRYAFLRCEDEREQCLHYLQTLNTVDFSCFTNAYSKSSILYQVLIFPSQKSAGASVTSSNVWLHVVGSLSETPLLRLPRGVIHFSFWAKNLGIITSLRMGHDNLGNNPNWLVEHVVIKNEFTGQAYKFACGRWLGSSIDDGSTERYMVGYPVTAETSIASLVTTCANSPDYTCPVTQLKSTSNRDADQELMAEEVVELQTMLGDAINKIVKFHHKSLNEKLSFAHLMCGQFGLVHTMLYIFSYGYKSARLFGRNLSVWDFFLKVTMDFNQSLPHLYQNHSNQNSPHASPRRTFNTLESPKRSIGHGLSMSSLLDSPKRTLGGGGGTPNVPQGATLSRSNQFRRMYTRLITRIETTCSRLGKDDKFQLFICLAVHDRLLGRIVTDLTKAVAAQQLYEDHAFFRDPTLVTFLSHILKALDDISVPVDPAMKKTLEQHQLFT